MVVPAPGTRSDVLLQHHTTPRASQGTAIAHSNAKRYLQRPDFGLHQHHPQLCYTGGQLLYQTFSKKISTTAVSDH